MKKFFLPILLLGSIGFSQITDVGTIYSKNYQFAEKAPVVKMPTFDLKSIQAEDAVRDLDKSRPFRFGKEFVVDIQPTRDGHWKTLENGDRIWQIVIESKDARTLNFAFENYQLSPNAKLYFYNEQNQFLGYYTNKENSKTKSVNSWLVDGDKVTVEFYEPASEIGQSTFAISRVIHGYRSVKNIEDQTKGLNTSGHCNVDVDCPAGDDWEVQKQAVAMILSGTTEWCSGTLINNTAEDGTPYFLTANHCLASSTPNWTFRFKWISETPDCGTNTPSGDGPKIYSLSGAQVVAKSANTDFALLKLNNEIPEDWNLSFVGWDRTGNTPENVTGLHHPDGDIMKIAQYYGSPTQSTRYNVKNWEIPAWDLGVTEGGSSGSSLFDQNGRLVGQLYGGTAACSGLGTNGGNDNYGRFDLSWEGDGTPSTRLKDWLDPDNTGLATLEYLGFQTSNNDLSLNAINVDPTCDNKVSPVVVVRNQGVNTVSSFSIKYKYNNESEATFNWTGTLDSKKNVSINLPEKTLNSGENTISAEVVYANDENPDNNSKTNSFSLQEPIGGKKVTFKLTTDKYGNETSWELKNSAGEVIESGADYGANSTYTFEFDNLENDCYSFIIYDEYSDGICCSYGNGSYSLTDAEGNVIFEGGSFGESETTNFKVDDSLSVDNNVKSNAISVYPNPTNDVFTLSVPQSFGKFNYEIYSAIGQKVAYGEASSNQNISMKSFGKGTYIVNIKTEKGNNFSKKIIVK